MGLTTPPPTWQQVIQHTVRRARWGYAVRGLCLGWFVGALASAILLSVAWALRWDISGAYPLGIAIALALAGLIAGATRRVRAEDAALWLDRQARTQERFSTARWLSARDTLRDMEQLQVADAETAAQSLDIRQLTRIPLPRTLWTALLATALAVFVWFAPDIPWLQSPRLRQEKQAMRVAGERADQMAQEWRKNATGQDREKMRKLSAEMAALAKQMQRARMSKREALVKLSRLQREAEDQQRRLAEANSGKPLQRAADQFLSARSVQQQIQQAKRERELTARLQTAALKTKDRQSSPLNAQPPVTSAQRATTPFANQMAMQMALALSQQDAQKLGELLRQIAEQWNRLSPEEREKLEELMRQLAEALKDTQLDAASKELLEALKNLKVGDLQKAVEWMRKASGT